MFSLAQTRSQGYRAGEVPLDEYEWDDRLFGKIGIKRVETKRFIRFEHLKVKQKENGYWYSRTSYWFIRFPYCKNDTQILVANIVALIIMLQVIGRIFSSLMSSSF